MRTVAAVVGIFVLLSAAATAGGYVVDRNRTDSLRDVLRRADRLATEEGSDETLPYFSLHNDLAAAAGVPSCSAFAVRMTQRFLPDGWGFYPEDVAALEAGETPPFIRVDMDQEVPSRWQC